jgi:hypothetical protein
MNDSQLKKAQRFYDLQVKEGCFLMPNAWDTAREAIERSKIP